VQAECCRHHRHLTGNMNTAVVAGTAGGGAARRWRNLAH
jgi:hypothetical protein